MSIYLLKNEIEMIHENTLRARQRFLDSFSQDEETRWRATMEKIELLQIRRSMKELDSVLESASNYGHQNYKTAQLREDLQPDPEMMFPATSVITSAQNALGNYYARDPDLLPDAVNTTIRRI
eukprot:758563-Hanusia_phi.AAC.5